MSPSIRKSASFMAPTLAALTLALAGCGDGGASDAPPSSAADAAVTPESPADAAPERTPTATRDDVIAALRCSAVLSSAMANRIVAGDGAAIVGLREQTRWFAEADRRAEAAGVSKEEFRTLMAETRAPMNTPEQQAENRPLLQQCLAETPPLR